MSGGPAVLLSSMMTEAVCELVRQIEGIDQSMLGQYGATIRKVGVTQHSCAQGFSETEMFVILRPTSTAEFCLSVTSMS